MAAYAVPFDNKLYGWIFCEKKADYTDTSPQSAKSCGSHVEFDRCPYPEQLTITRYRDKALQEQPPWSK